MALEDQKPEDTNQMIEDEAQRRLLNRRWSANDIPTAVR
jgi:hypothetical protein